MLAIELQEENAFKVLVAHPGRQYSHHTALALHERGLLAGYWSGIPAPSRTFRYIPESIWRRFVTYEDVNLPQSLVRTRLLAPLVNRTCARMLPSGTAEYFNHWAFRRFDRWVASQIGGSCFNALIAYENSALYSFRAAKEIGIRCILDAASFHHKTQDRFTSPAVSENFHKEITSKKDAEIELADLVITTSHLAESSYRDHGIPESKLYAVPLGVDLDVFQYIEKKNTHWKNHLRFAFIGHASKRKGVHHLAAAAHRLRKEGYAFNIEFIGNRSSDVEKNFNQIANVITITGGINQRFLASAFRDIDCLLLPSGHDSFGMVVAEALACGVPAIVSSMVGAKQLIDEGRNGWVVPVGDVDALARQMAWCIRNAEQVRAMGPAARASAENYSWERYHERLVAAITQGLA